MFYIRGGKVFKGDAKVEYYRNGQNMPQVRLRYGRNIRAIDVVPLVIVIPKKEKTGRGEISNIHIH